jgi:hypothetical protein
MSNTWLGHFASKNPANNQMLARASVTRSVAAAASAAARRGMATGKDVRFGAEVSARLWIARMFRKAPVGSPASVVSHGARDCRPGR